MRYAAALFMPVFVTNQHGNTRVAHESHCYVPNEAIILLYYRLWPNVTCRYLANRTVVNLERVI